MRILESKLWISLAVLGALVVTTMAAFGHLGGQVPVLKPFRRAGDGPREFLASTRVQDWFSPAPSGALQAGSNQINPFFTLQFQPPPPPPTKPVELLYQGSYTPTKGSTFAYLRLGDALLIVTNGAKVVADHGVQEITLRRVVLTNAAGVTNVLEFNVKRTLQVPAS